MIETYILIISNIHNLKINSLSKEIKIMNFTFRYILEFGLGGY